MYFRCGSSVPLLCTLLALWIVSKGHCGSGLRAGAPWQYCVAVWTVDQFKGEAHDGCILH